MVSYEYVLGGVLVSLLGAIFIMIISSTLGGKKQFKASGVGNGYGNGEFLPEMEEEKSTDVVIVGAGDAGAALAYTLAKIVSFVATNESIDAQKVIGYALYKGGKDTALSYPLEKYSSDVAGSVTTLIEEKSIVKGVIYKNKAGEEMRTYAPLTIVCDGCFSNLQKSLSTPKVESPSCFVGLILENCELPHANHGHVILGDPSPILFYPTSSTEFRCLVDVPGPKVPSVASASLPSPPLPEQFRNQPNLSAPSVSSLRRNLDTIAPDEIYNLVAQSHVAVSFEILEYTADIVATGDLRSALHHRNIPQMERVIFIRW
ncbi:hypothetical protein ACLB2K_020922 [Fragaria x ananassa]